MVTDNSYKLPYGSVLAALFAGPVVRTIFGLIFKEKKAVKTNETASNTELNAE